MKGDLGLEVDAQLDAALNRRDEAILGRAPQRCNCNDKCWQCDVGNQGDDCTCFNPCPVHPSTPSTRTTND